MTETVEHAVTPPPVSDVDPFSHENLENPDPLHRGLREAGPVVFLPRYEVHAFARYEQVHAALVDWQHFESGSGAGLANFRDEKPWRAPSLLLEADPPLHDAPRRALRDILAPPTLRRLRATWADLAEALVDQVLSCGAEFDALPALAEAFPLRAFPDAVGLGPDGRENLLPYGNMAFNAFGPRNDLVAADAHRAADLSAWVGAQCQREALAPDGFGADIWAAADRGDLTHAQAPLVVRSLLTAGVDTTVHGLAACLYAFATHPVEWQRLRERPALARVAFDEAVRWQSPVQTFFRTATTDVSIAGSIIPEGTKILMFLGSANRDPDRWDDPDRFDLTRDPSGHVGFGMGLHQCVGQHVARLEAEALLTALVRRVESFELLGTPRRHLNNTLRAWASLPVRVHPVR
ncbi:cytochrome P450 [Streptomyces sp. NPDC005786]|uniref:cytochrome P450 n=1 Tax=Streptomyces sp. NPDC005786 TaxID=3154891 RepID=UPI0033C32E78